MWKWVFIGVLIVLFLSFLTWYFIGQPFREIEPLGAVKI